MTVLMFGWEFPPHISGGLGTACAGLTSALEKADVDVLFTIPKLYGGESADRTTFINASAIPILQQTFFPPDAPSDAIRLVSSRSVRSGEDVTKTDGRRTLLEVDAHLMPYQAPSRTTLNVGLEQWNYAFASATDRSLPANLRPRHPAKQDSHQLVRAPYAFSGTYGPTLMDEVQKYALAASEIAHRYTFDVIHAHDWMTYPAGIAAKKLTGKPLVVHVHATEIDRSGTHVNAEVYAIEKDGMQKADKVVTVSHWTKEIVMKHYQIPGDKIVVVHNGITPRENPAPTVSHVPPLGCPVVTFLGRVTHQKGPMFFVDAARSIHAKFPEAHFVVAGSGDQLPKMIERIAQVRMSRCFHFTGFLRGQDVDRIWAMSTVYAMPSVSEPFGIAPLEAIQAGVPVILSKQAGVSEVMPHAIKVDFWNTEALAEAICNVLRFGSLANTLRKNGVEQIKDITWDKAAKKITSLYYEVSPKHEKPKKSDLLLSGPSAKKAASTPVL